MAHYLVTGGAGFIGSHLVERLLGHDHRVTVLDDCSTGSLKNLAAVERNPLLRVVVDTAADDDVVFPLVREADAVFHLASPVGVMHVMEDPHATLDEMILAGKIVLDNCSGHGKPVLLASSSEVYGLHAGCVTEDSPLSIPALHRRWHYAVGKLVNEFQAKALVDTRGLKCVIARIFNTAGPRQTGRYGMVVPRFVSQALLNEPLTVFGDGAQTRSFGHVKDTARMLHDLLGRGAEHHYWGQAFNVGSNEEIHIIQLAGRVRAILKSDSPIRHISAEMAYGVEFSETDRRRPVLTKLLSVTSPPEYELEEIIADTAEWMKTEGNERAPEVKGVT